MSGTCKCGGECGECWCMKKDDEAEKAAREIVKESYFDTYEQAVLAGMQYEQVRMRKVIRQICPSYIANLKDQRTNEALLSYVIPVNELERLFKEGGE